MNTHKKLKDLTGLNISYFGRTFNSILYEKYGILDRDKEFKNKLKELSDIFTKQTHIYNELYNEIEIEGLTEWLLKLKIIIDYSYENSAVFDVYDNFELTDNKDKVKYAVIKLNPKNIHPDDLGPSIYHEIKHIYDYLILKAEEPLKENLFRDLIYKSDLDFINYKKNFIELLDNITDIMNFISNCLFYVEKSECSAYLENIDQDYKDTLNNRDIIFGLMYNGYKISQIKNILYYNQTTGNYVIIYNNIYRYLTELQNTIVDNLNKEINKEYRDLFKDIYNVTNLKAVINIYLKRIDKLLSHTDKLFYDRYKNSLLSTLIKK